MLAPAGQRSGVFIFFLSRMGGKEVYKRCRLKGWKERTDASAGKKTSFPEKVLVLY